MTFSEIHAIHDPESGYELRVRSGSTGANRPRIEFSVASFDDGEKIVSWLDVSPAEAARFARAILRHVRTTERGNHDR